MCARTNSRASAFDARSMLLFDVESVVFEPLYDEGYDVRLHVLYSGYKGIVLASSMGDIYIYTLGRFNFVFQI